MQSNRETGTKAEPQLDTPAPLRHYWLPSGDRVRHAFRGRRWMHQEADTSICGRQVSMHLPTEAEWFTSPTCPDCNRALKTEATP